jgi:hypothetical protein
MDIFLTAERGFDGVTYHTFLPLFIFNYINGLTLFLKNVFKLKNMKQIQNKPKS